MTKYKKVTSTSSVPMFQFWKDNKLEGHYTLSLEELKEKFTAWVATKDKNWVNYYATDRAIRFFIPDKEGLSSVFEESEFDDMYPALKEIYIAAHK